MVFSYKIITDSPRRSVCVSPRKGSPRRLPQICSSTSQLLNSLDYDLYQDDDIIDSIPEREWRLLAALARKRDEETQRQKLADQFRQMWQKEKEERDLIEAVNSDQYKRYIHKKREQERIWLDYRLMQRKAEQQIKTGQLMDCIQHKHRRSENLMAWNHDKRASDIIGKVIEDEAKAILVADRRSRIGEAEEWRRRLELADVERKVDDARRRRNAMLKDASQRVAISNALNTWETSILRQEVTAMEAVKRAHHAARAALTDARSLRLARARECRTRRARRLAAFTSQLRELVRDRRM